MWRAWALNGVSPVSALLRKTLLSHQHAGQLIRSCSQARWAIAHDIGLLGWMAKLRESLLLSCCRISGLWVGRVSRAQLPPSHWGFKLVWAGPGRKNKTQSPLQTRPLVVICRSCLMEKWDFVFPSRSWSSCGDARRFWRRTMASCYWFCSHGSWLRVHWAISVFH